MSFFFSLNANLPEGSSKRPSQPPPKVSVLGMSINLISLWGIFFLVMPIGIRSLHHFVHGMQMSILGVCPDVAFHSVVFYYYFCRSRNNIELRRRRFFSADSVPSVPSTY